MLRWVLYASAGIVSEDVLQAAPVFVRGAPLAMARPCARGTGESCAGGVRGELTYNAWRSSIEVVRGCARASIAAKWNKLCGYG